MERIFFFKAGIENDGENNFLQKRRDRKWREYFFAKKEVQKMERIFLGKNEVYKMERIFLGKKGGIENDGENIFF